MAKIVAAAADVGELGSKAFRECVEALSAIKVSEPTDEHLSD